MCFVQPFQKDNGSFTDSGQMCLCSSTGLLGVLSLYIALPRWLLGTYLSHTPCLDSVHSGPSELTCAKAPQGCALGPVSHLHSALPSCYSVISHTRLPLLGQVQPYIA